jgi:hypothetical protein
MTRCRDILLVADPWHQETVELRHRKSATKQKRRSRRRSQSPLMRDSYVPPAPPRNWKAPNQAREWRMPGISSARQLRRERTCLASGARPEWCSTNAAHVGSETHRPYSKKRRCVTILRTSHRYISRGGFRGVGRLRRRAEQSRPFADLILGERVNPTLSTG